MFTRPQYHVARGLTALEGERGDAHARRRRLAVAFFLVAVVIPAGIDLSGLYLTALRCFLLCTTLPLTFGLFAGRYGHFAIVDALILAHITFVLAALWYNHPTEVLENGGVTALEIWGPYLVARCLIQTGDDLVFAMKTLAALIIASLPFAIYESLTGDAFLLNFLSQFPYLRVYDVANDAPRCGIYRAQVFMAHPIHYGMFCAIFLMPIFVLLTGYISESARYTLALGCLAGVALSMSSGPILVAGLQIALVIWSWAFRGSVTSWFVLAGTIAALFASIEYLSNRGAIEVLVSYITFSPHNAYWRLMTFEWGFKTVSYNMLFGIGMSDWERPNFMVTDSVDNFWLLIAMRYGLPAVALFAACWIPWKSISGEKDSLNTSRSSFDQVISLSRISLSIGLATVHVWGNAWAFVLFAIGVRTALPISNFSSTLRYK